MIVKWRFIAVVEEEGKPKEIGVARYATNPDRKSCEFAIVVADQWQGQQIGTELMKDLLSSARKRGFKTMKGEILVENHKMINFVKKLLRRQIGPGRPELRLATKTL